MNTDVFHWHAHAHIDQYTLDQIEVCRIALGLDREPIGAELAAFTSPDISWDYDGNLLVRQGLQRIGDRLTSVASNQGFDATHGRIGVGDGTTAAAATDTDLSAAAGSAHRQFVLVDSAPTSGTGASSGVYTFVATHTTGLSNFHWQEWGIDGGTANGTTVTTDANTTPGLINHKVVDMGTKTSAVAWVFTATITGS